MLRKGLLSIDDKGDNAMISNIVVLGINRGATRQVAEMLSEQLQMHFVDTLELFEFDNIPRSLSDILREQGEAYFRKKEKSLNGYVSEFENTVIHAESGSVLNSKKIKEFKKNCLIVYIHYSASKVQKLLKSSEYKTKELKKFFNISLERINRRVELLKKHADISINGNGKSAFKITAETLRAIDDYFLN